MSIQEKIQELSKKMENNEVCKNKKSCCFWCSCDYDTQSIYIPKHIINNIYQVYGNFCSLECASGFLFEEELCNIVKFERFHLLHSLYKDVYQGDVIKPAPKPFYLLDKFYGNLSIEEYRKLNCSLIDNTLCFTNKPISCISPDVNEINTNSIINCSKNLQQKKVETNTTNIGKNAFSLLLG